MEQAKSRMWSFVGWAGVLLALASPALAVEPHGEMNLVLPDFTSVTFLGMTGRTLLTSGIFVCALGFAFGLMIYQQLKSLPVHQSMREISELI